MSHQFTLLIGLYEVIASLMGVVMHSGSRRSTISSLELILRHAASCPSTIASVTARVYQIYLAGICCISTAVEMHWPMLQP